MSVLYKFPEQAAFGRIIPKTKIYKNARLGTKVKGLFVQQVEKIIWSYKLSPETINLPTRDGVEEFQVLTIVLKTGTLRDVVLQAIDKVIPSPILFELSFQNKIRYVAAYKRPSEADSGKWVVSSYFETKWFSKNSKRVALPVVLDLCTLYCNILKSFIPLPSRDKETLDELIVRADQLKMLQRESSKAISRMKREKQFNRKVEINAELRNLGQEIEGLSQ